MTRHPLAFSTHRCRAALLLLTAALVWSAAPAAAQYGGGVSIVVDPIRVEVGTGFAYFGSSCPAGSTVTITIDGFPGILDTTIANDDSSFGGTTVSLPPGAMAGEDYVVRATCDGESATTVIRAVCEGGTDPVDGECPDPTDGGGGTTGGGTTTTTPGGGTDGGPGGGGTDGGPDGGGSDGNNGGPDGNGTGSNTTGTTLPVTGASTVEQAAQAGVTLVALGAILVMFTLRRRENEPV